MIIDNWGPDGLLYTQYNGIVTGKELIESSLKKSGDERFDGIQFIMADWTNVKESRISPQEVTELIAYLKAISQICPYAKNGSIVNRNDTGMALAAWYRHLGETLSWQIDIFHDVETAFDTYGINPDTIQLAG